MANYVKATNFAVKDSLSSGNPAKIVKGTEIDTEFNAIASAIASKVDADSPTLTGTPLAPTAAGGTNTTQIATTAFVTAAISTERTATATLTNKTISGASNTLTVRLDQADVTGTLPVSKGGTGATTHTANNVLIGNGTSAITSIAPGTSGNALISDGTTWSSGSPAKLSTASGSAPSYSARAWVNFDGTNAFSPNPSTTAIRASGNVSSITDNNTGDYTINLTTAMPNANYVIAGSSGGQNSTSTGSVYQYDQLTPKTTSAFRIGTLNVAGAPVDSPQIAVAVFV